METIITPSIPKTSTAEEIAMLMGLEHNSEIMAQALGFFQPAEEIVVARAPGRLDLMGGIADYSGSLVLQWPIAEATTVALQRTPERSLAIRSLGAEANGRAASFSLPLASFEVSGSPATYETARKVFSRDSQSHWAAYVAGAFLVLMRERGARFDTGARILISSQVPEGKGVSSSAAIEVATMQAIAAAYDISLQPRELAILCQKVENHIVGAPCGVMDQMVSAVGEQGALTALQCQPAELMGNVVLPEGVSVWGLDSGVRHSVAGAHYGAVRTAAFMGLSIIERLSKRSLGGYLAKLTPSEFEQHFAAKIPEKLLGADYLADFGGVSDPLSQVQPGCTYAVRAAAAHPIYEHFRVQAFAELLDGKPTDRRLRLLGELMYQSHASYSACGLGSRATDQIVSLVRETGPSRGLYGAKITGGGSGGTVAVLGRADAQPTVDDVVARYSAESGYRPYVFSGSSPGAAAYGIKRVRLDR